VVLWPNIPNPSTSQTTKHGTGNSGEFPGASNAIAVVDPDLNFKRGKVVSAPITLLSDLRVQYKTSGIFLRIRAWDDVALEGMAVPARKPR